MPTIWRIEEQQNTTNAYLFDTYIYGRYLDNLTPTQWLCFYFFYEMDADLPYKVSYDQGAQAQASTLTCSFAHSL